MFRGKNKTIIVNRDICLFIDFSWCIRGQWGVSLFLELITCNEYAGPSLPLVMLIIISTIYFYKVGLITLTRVANHQHIPIFQKLGKIVNLILWVCNRLAPNLTNFRTLNNSEGLEACSKCKIEFIYNW